MERAGSVGVGPGGDPVAPPESLPERFEAIRLDFLGQSRSLSLQAAERRLEPLLTDLLDPHRFLDDFPAERERLERLEGGPDLLEATREAHAMSPRVWMLRRTVFELAGREFGDPAWLWLPREWPIAKEFRPFGTVPCGEDGAFDALCELEGGWPVIVTSYAPFDLLAAELQAIADEQGFRPAELLRHIFTGRPRLEKLTRIRPRLVIPLTDRLMKVGPRGVDSRLPRFAPSDGEMRQLGRFYRRVLPRRKDALLDRLWREECEYHSDHRDCRSTKVAEQVAERWPGKKTLTQVLDDWNRS